MLVEELGIQAAVTGYDFQFGKGRRGTPQLLTERGILHGFSVTVVDAFIEGSGAVSSTRIRSALADGDLATANNLLGWRYAIGGEIIHGDGRGRDLGYPTANMLTDPATELKHGIYAVRFVRQGGEVYEGVASYGRRPTFGGGEPVLETFVFDLSGDLYGERALVSFCAFLRDEQRFDSAAALVESMDQDSIDARAFLERSPPSELDRRIYSAWTGLTNRRKAVAR
jgi:riboflavin kinase/FMN adenylyltransferase